MLISLPTSYAIGIILTAVGLNTNKWCKKEDEKNGQNLQCDFQQLLETDQYLLSPAH